MNNPAVIPQKRIILMVHVIMAPPLKTRKTPMRISTTPSTYSATYDQYSSAFPNQLEKSKKPLGFGS